MLACRIASAKIGLIEPGDTRAASVVSLQPQPMQCPS